MESVDAIDAQIEDLMKKREEVKKAERAEDLKTVKSLIKKHGFTDIALERVLVKGKRRKASSKAD